MRLLIDENLSPALVDHLADKGIFAQHAAHVGFGGLSDPEVWRRAFERDQVVVTTNARDFLQLADGVDLHPGLIVIRRSGLTRDEQWQHLAPVVDRILETGEKLINRTVEVWGVDAFEIRDLPPAERPKT